MSQNNSVINKFFNSIKKIGGYILFLRDFYIFKSRNQTSRLSINWMNRYVCLEDKTSTTTFDRHYIYHTAWAARILAKTRPKEHTDISSYLYFSTLISAFIPIKFYDYRPAQINLNGLETQKADILSLPFKNNSIDSLSSMHVVEHIGLGRYGDPIDPDGDLKAINELKRVFAKGGQLLFVAPIGKPKIQFNAHRIYSYAQIINYFSDLTLMDFSLITDDDYKENDFITNASKELADQQEYGCGCFWFSKH